MSGSPTHDKVQSGLETTRTMSIDGLWLNEYGSAAELRRTGSLVTGTYSSHTGATGTYPVLGVVAPGELVPDRGLAISLAIGWRPLTEGAYHESWSWCSAMSGQVMLTCGGPKMILQHILIAATEARGLCPAGLYPDKLIFEWSNTSATNASISPNQDEIKGSVSRENWIDDIGREILFKFERQGSDFDIVTGLLRCAEGDCDIHGISQTNGRLRSLAFTCHIAGSRTTTAWASYFDCYAEQIVMHRFESRGTTADATYLQTSLDSSTFRRSPR